MKVKFPRETLQKIIEILRPDVERMVTLCISEDNSIYLGEPVKKGTKTSVPTITKDEMVCPAGTKPIGTIHTHLEEYSMKPPFDRGFSNEDIFALVKDALNKRIDLPYLGCVLSPVFDGDLKALRIDCEYYRPFTEEDIKKMPSGIVRIEDGKEIEEPIGEKGIEAIKYGEVPRGILRSLGFTVAMANLKIGLKEKGFMSQGTIILPVKDDMIEIKDEVMKLE